MSLRKHAGKFRSLLPQSARERLYELSPGRARRWERHPGIQHVDPGGHVVLTFDDGPDPEVTPLVLDALDTASARATFFLLGTQLRASAELGHEIIRRGHEIGLHGFSHERHDRIDARQSRDDVARGFAELGDTLGVRCNWYRPPYGKMSPSAAGACQELGMSTVYWSAWGLDWERVDATRIADVASEQLDDGGILLLHDSARFARRPSALPTAHAIPLIAERASARGWSLLSLSQAIPTNASVGS